MHRFDRLQDLYQIPTGRYTRWSIVVLGWQRHFDNILMLCFVSIQCFSLLWAVSRFCFVLENLFLMSLYIRFFCVLWVDRHRFWHLIFFFEIHVRLGLESHTAITLCWILVHIWLWPGGYDQGVIFTQGWVQPLEAAVNMRCVGRWEEGTFCRQLHRASACSESVSPSPDSLKTFVLCFSDLIFLGILILNFKCRGTFFRSDVLSVRASMRKGTIQPLHDYNKNLLIKWINIDTGRISYQMKDLQGYPGYKVLFHKVWK